MANRFVITCAARTGSTMLRMMLNAHPDICCHGEVLTPDHRHATRMVGLKSDEKSNVIDLILQTRKADPVRFLRDFVLYAGTFPSVGVKIKYPELLHESGARVLDWIAGNTDIKIIHLKRRNLLRRFVSHQLAMQSGVNLVKIGDPAPTYKKLTISVEQCFCDMDATLRMEEEFDAIFAGHPVKQVEYERLAVPSSRELDEILDFLEVHRVPLESPLMKLGGQNLAEVIENYEELRRRAAGSRHEHCFD